ncbi:MAG: AAA family ATPase [Deltaproteobacteria bacterium]|nr:AAA family ATPase [Deltaproteobacteria bacterium]
MPDASELTVCNPNPVPERNVMYNKFFSFREKPFKLVPNPEYYYVSRSHEEAMAHLKYAIADGEGFVEITGEVGTGKTTLCRVFLDSLDERTEVAYIFNPRLGPTQLLKTIADELGVKCRANDTKQLIDALNTYLIEMKIAGKTVVLLVDEAQNLTRDVMEQLRLLSNLETNRSKMLQIILVGQPELGELLDSYDLRQLAQRITLSCQLTPLSFREVREYIEHRIQIAASKTPVVFTYAACRRIDRYAKGIPRLINIVCDRALLTAYGRNQKKITAAIVRAAIGELSARGKKRSRLRDLKKPALVLAAVLCAAALLFWFYRMGSAGSVKTVNKGHEDAQRQAPPPVAPSTAPIADTPTQTPAVVGPNGASTAFSHFIHDMDVRSARHTALQSVLDLWDLDFRIDPALDGRTDNDSFFEAAAAQNGLAMLHIDCRLDVLKTLNLPAIVSVRIPGGSSPGFLTVLGIRGDQVALGRARLKETITVTEGVLKSYCADGIYVPWKDFMAPGGPPGDRAPQEAIVRLKTLLNEIGYTQFDTSSSYDERTKEAIRQVQEKHGLETDGVVGALTKIVLFNENPRLEIPHIRHE